MLAEYLAFRGISVLQATDGESALKLARERCPVLILMDLQLPGTDGYDATRLLKADPATKDIIIVAVTAHAMQPDEGKALEAGCDGYIAKPFDILAVGDAVVNIVARGRPGLRMIVALTPPTAPPSSGQTNVPK
jgi:two-component system cell cycle response regulator DivK